MIDIKALAKEQEEYVIACRRHLHQHPELGLQEYETTKFIVNELKKLPNCEIITYPDITGCIAVFHGTGKASGENAGKTVMLRADIDALPIQEAKDIVPFCSVNDGVMHACGHDCHTAMLLGAARIINDHVDEFAGTVKLIFQMAEEIAKYAEQYVFRGALDDVDAIYGSHVWGTIPSGKMNCSAGPRMACSDRFTIRIHGVLAHGSAPHLGKDAILAAAAVVLALQTIVSRINDPQHPLVVTTGMMNGGTKENILADDVELVGTVRTFDREFRNSMPDRIRKIAESVAEGYGCSAACDYYFGPSPLINDAQDLVDIAQGAIKKIAGEDCLVPHDMSLGAEDFSAFTEKVPGVYAYIGTADHEKGTDYPNHSPFFKVDEDVLWMGTGAYVQFAKDYLEA